MKKQQPSKRKNSTGSSENSQDNAIWGIGCLCIIVGVIMLFISPPTGLVILFMSWIVYQIYNQTPTGKAEAKEKAEQEAIRARLPETITKKFQTLKTDPKNKELLYEIIYSMDKLDQPKLNEKMATVGISLLLMYAQQPEVRENLFKLADNSQSSWANIHMTTTDFYKAALKILEENPDAPGLRQYALRVGRWSYSKFNGGKITIAQEQSIQNDIFVRIR